MEFVKPKKIFIVDDDTLTTEALTDYLTRNVQHHVRSFATGEECLKNMEDTPEVVVLDYYLNSVHKEAADGMEILHVIRKNYPGTHVIMLSAQEHYAVAIQSIHDGADQYVVKDNDAFQKVEELIRAI